MKKIHLKEYKDDFVLSESVAKKTIKKLGRTLKIQPWNRKKLTKN